MIRPQQVFRGLLPSLHRDFLPKLTNFPARSCLRRSAKLYFNPRRTPARLLAFLSGRCASAPRRMSAFHGGFVALFRRVVNAAMTRDCGKNFLTEKRTTGLMVNI